MNFTQKKFTFHNFYANFSKNQRGSTPPFQNSGGVATPPAPPLWRPCCLGKGERVAMGSRPSLKNLWAQSFGAPQIGKNYNKM